MAVDHVLRHTESLSYFQASTRYHENEGKTEQSSADAVHGLCCTRCMLYSVSTHDYDIVKSRGMTELCVLR
jgi:hypothetical protein